MKDTIALLAAVHQELAPCVAHLSLRRRGKQYIGCVGDRRIVAMTSGVGGNRAMEAIDQLAAGQRPIRLIHIGFAGALDPTLQVADVPDFRWVMDESGARIELDGAGPKPGSAPSRAADGLKLLTVAQLAGSARMKRCLFERHGACAVDMESYAVARHAAGLTLPLTILRAISDKAETDIPSAAVSWVNSDGSTNWRAATRYLAARPWHVRAMMHLKQSGHLAAERLAERVAELIH